MAPATCVPVKELKNTAAFTETVQAADGPVLVTKNGREVFATMSMEVYEALVTEAARARLYQEVEAGEDDISEGRHREAEDVVASLKAVYGL